MNTGRENHGISLTIGRSSRADGCCLEILWPVAAQDSIESFQGRHDSGRGTSVGSWGESVRRRVGKIVQLDGLVPVWAAERIALNGESRRA